MRDSRPQTAVAIALLAVAALATAGCGLGPGDDLGEVSLTVSRDFGAERLPGPSADVASESDTVMRVLERNAEISTRFGGGFVQSIDGLEAVERPGAGPADWFFYVNGVESTVGAADYSLRGGEAIWWDYHDWAAAMGIPAVVGSWPQPFSGGYDGRRRPVAVACRGGEEACALVVDRLREAGAPPSGGAPAGAIRVLVGPWRSLRHDPAAAALERGPQASGVFAEFLGEGPSCRLEGLDEAGDHGSTFGAGAGLVAATRRYDAPPVWMVTGCDGDGVAAAARLLDAADLRDRFAVATEAGAGPPVALPLPIGAGPR